MEDHMNDYTFSETEQLVTGNRKCIGIIRELTRVVVNIRDICIPAQLPCHFHYITVHFAVRL